ncbi:MAG: flagellar basal body L-ring protein FlgH [Gammaproteobacteria bacterium]|jgi:flagellar L-ring protein precursor FlgH
MKALRTTYLIALGSAVLAGCATAPETVTEEYAPRTPIPAPQDARTSGAIYNPTFGFSLFDDQRARSVGDVLTIRLIEETQASKTASTDTNRATSVDTGSPVIFGRSITDDGLDLLNSNIESSQSFEGSASSSQSNQLIGDITVTVYDVLVNGNLIVRGEKWLTLNQGEEYIRISGIVRPSDISPDNSVESWRLADARITYSGKGSLANSNRGGWLTRFFSTVMSPF